MYRVGIRRGRTVDVGPARYMDLAAAIERADECASVCWAECYVIRWSDLETVYTAKKGERA